jgi:hypothetical protein
MALCLQEIRTGIGILPGRFVISLGSFCQGKIQKLNAVAEVIRIIRIFLHQGINVNLTIDLDDE